MPIINLKQPSEMIILELINSTALEQLKLEDLFFRPPIIIDYLERNTRMTIVPKTNKFYGRKHILYNRLDLSRFVLPEALVFVKNGRETTHEFIPELNERLGLAISLDEVYNTPMNPGATEALVSFKETSTCWVNSFRISVVNTITENPYSEFALRVPGGWKPSYSGSQMDIRLQEIGAVLETPPPIVEG